METVVNKVHKNLLKRKKTIAVAESCTGGLLSSLLTSLSGSSKYFSLGLVTYSNKVKENILKIPGRLIAKEGVVSKKVAEMMAEQVRILAKTAYGISITGIAGPDGGSLKKPKGTVYIALRGPKTKICKKLFFRGSRKTIQKKSAYMALELLLSIL